MSNLQQSIDFIKSQLSKDFIFINVKPDILRTLIDGLEEQQREIVELKWKVAHPVICQGICTSQLDDYCGMHMSNESCIACASIWTNAHVENKEWDMKQLQAEHTAMKDVIYQALTSLQMEHPMSAESTLEDFVSTLTKEASA